MSGPFTPTELPPIAGLIIRPLNDARVAERIHVLDQYCFPVKYSEEYYEKYVRGGLHAYNQVAYYHELLVGSITCRLERTDVEGEFKLYIMTIGVLEAYRHMGIGRRLLQTILNLVYNDQLNRISCVTLHVQVGSSALEFYKNFDFEIAEEVAGYYADLEEKNALLLRRVIPQPHLGSVKEQKKDRKGGN